MEYKHELTPIIREMMTQKATMRFLNSAKGKRIGIHYIGDYLGLSIFVSINRRDYTRKKWKYLKVKDEKTGFDSQISWTIEANSRFKKSDILDFLDSGFYKGEVQ